MKGTKVGAYEKARLARMQELCNRLPLLKVELMDAGLYETAHELEHAIKKIGWEYADYIGGKRAFV